MLSRVANSLYWMARNIERTENIARVMSVQLINTLEASDEETLADLDWDMVVAICASHQELEHIKNNKGLDEEYILDYLASSKVNQNSLINCIDIARENARTSRDHLPNDIFEIWNDFFLYAEGLREGKLTKESINKYLRRIKSTSLTIQGAIESSMSRGRPYRFLKIGKWLEKAENTARTLNVVCCHSREGEAETNRYYNWRFALQLLNGYEAYLKQFPPIMEPKNVLSFLITEESFPRSIRYCIDHIRDAIIDVEQGKISHYSREIFSALDELTAEFTEMKIQELNLSELCQFLDYFQNRCNEIGQIFSETYYLTERNNRIKSGSQTQSQHVINTHTEKNAHMKFQIEHINNFDYEAPVDSSMNTIRLKPRTDECQRLLSYRSEISPGSLTKEHVDIWGNHVEEFYIPEQHTHLEVKTTSVVSVQRSPFIHHIKYTPEMKGIFTSKLFREHYLSFLNDTPNTYLKKEQVDQVVDELGGMEDPVDFSLKVMEYLHDRFTYHTNSTNVHTKAEEAFEQKSGVCQDMTNVMLGILRANNIPARYVSGYLYVGEGSALIGDAATHAWVEVMLPGIGWTGLDPTNNVEALENHIRIATGRDYHDVSPLQGFYRGGKSNLDVSVSVKVLDVN